VTALLRNAALSPLPLLQVETNTGEQYHTALSLNDCLDLAVERCALFFRKVAVSGPHAPQDEARLLSSLEAMWQGRRRGSSAALRGGRASSGSGSRQRRAKRKPGVQHSRSAVSPECD
jgi:hypothetical protein